MEDDQRERAKATPPKKFQSTSPVWRTTAMSVFILFIIVISIHVPRVEDDADMISEAREDKIFQSTSPVWRTT